MSAAFDEIHNHREPAVLDGIAELAPSYPHFSTDLLADVACVALNRLPPRYIRHTVDFSFYLTEQERLQMDTAIVDAVAYAFNFVSARTAMRARA